MNSRKLWHSALISVFFFACSFTLVGTTVAELTPYPGSILFKQTNTLIIERDDVKWEGVPEIDWYLAFSSIMSSLDGSRILFNAKCEFCSEAEAGYRNRPFVADAMGENIQDVSDIFPSDLANSWSGWRYMRINDNGNRIFIKAARNDGSYYGTYSLYYMDLSTGEVQKSVSNDFNSDWYTINKDGSRLYLGEYDEGYIDVLGRKRRGLYYANLGGAMTNYLDLFNETPPLPCTDQCLNLNMMTYMGSSLTGDHTFFKWDSGYAVFCLEEDCPLEEALWHTGMDGQATRVTPGDHYYVDNNSHGGWRGISTESGESVVYAYEHLKGDPLELYAVNRANEMEQLLTWTTSGNGYDEYFITPSGRYVFLRGTMGNSGGLHYHTLFDQNLGTARDSWSYYLPRVVSMSNMVQDRYYFVTYSHAIYRIDTKADVSGSFSQAPNISRIAFSEPVLWDDDTQLSVTVNVSDNQGLENVEKVRLAVLVEGMENTHWPMGREPLAFPDGDPGSTLLYDDGTHGDLTEGDGVFSFDAIATRKGDRDEDGFNTWYFHYTLPNDVGIRILAHDLDGNSTIADTKLTIVDCTTEEKSIGQDVDGDLMLCVGDRITLGPNITVKRNSNVYLRAGNVVFGFNTSVEKGAVLSIETRQ